MRTCAPEPGYAATTNDCDDGDPAVHPGAPDPCDDVDEDCDGSPCGLPAVLGAEQAAARLHGEKPGDEAGALVVPAGDLDGDGFEDLLVFAPESEDPGPFSGKVYVVRGPILGGDRNLADVDTWILAEGPYIPITALAAPGDLDGDGYDDVVMGAQSERDGLASGAGTVRIFFGPLGPGALTPQDADVHLLGVQEDGSVGSSVAGAGDVDGDGLADLLVGAPGDIGGRIYLYWDLLEPGWWGVGKANVAFVAEDDDDGLGSTWHGIASAGDVDADGLDDVLLGAPDAQEWPRDRAGTAYLFLSPPSPGEIPCRAADLVLVGVEGGDSIGGEVAGAGDVDGDGRDEFLLGADGARVVEGNGVAGAAWLFRGGSSGSDFVTDAPISFAASEANEGFGAVVTSAGDVDGDGFDDVIVGEPYGGGTKEPGRVYLYYGPVGDGIHDAASADVRFEGAPWDAAGSSVAGGADLDGDGLDDVVVGAPGWGSEGLEGAGVVYVLFGRGRTP